MLNISYNKCQKGL